MNTSMIEVVFKVYADVGFGEEIYLSGNVPALGCNDLTRAIPLVTSTKDFPWWRTKEGLFLSGEAGFVKYRYCIFSGGEFKRWEGEFRTLDVSDDRSLVKATEDKFGLYSTERNVSQSPKKPTVTVTKDDHSLRAKLYAAWNRNKPMDRTLKSTDSVIMVSYFLPVILNRNRNGRWAAAWDREALLSSLQLNVSRVTWVGSVRYGNLPIPAEEEEAVISVLAELNCVPVFVTQPMHLKFYEGFCKKSLWSVLHHIVDVYGPLQQSDKLLNIEQDLWFNYSTVHKLFREKILEVYQNGSLIWIHGFHLMLLPSFLRRRLPQAKIGYFLHTPFPSSEIWRTMTRREDLLRGLLGADQIGFLLYEYARHFLSTCHRLLGYTSEMNSAGMISVNVDGRQVSITCIHVGVDMLRSQEVFNSSTFKSEVTMWKEKFRQKVIVSGIDRLERLKGIPLRLMAIDQFLERNSHWVGKVVFALIGVSAGERGHDYKQTVHDVRILVERINSKYGVVNGVGVIYFEERPEKDIKFAQRLAYFAVSDILLMTATRDGLNRYPMEFTLARREYGKLIAEGVISNSERLDGAGAADQGLIIISEFISSARVMRGAMIVNPWRVEEVISALEQSLRMNDGDRAERSRRNLEFSARLTASSWAKYVLNDLIAAEGSADPNSNYAVGFGMQYKVMNFKAGFHSLDTKEVAKAFRVAKNRLILLDWGGTLVPNIDKHDKLHAFALATGHATQLGPTEELSGVLETLCSDPKNLIFVVSGKEMRAVQKFFGTIHGLGLGAEHGFYYKWPREEISQDVNDCGNQKLKWQTIMHIADDSWKESAKIVMDIFVQRTHGTYIEVKGNALIWQFSDADPEFGFLQSKELEDHLHSILANHPVEIIRGGGVADGYIEVRPAGASKGLFLEHVLSMMKAQNMEADFILTIGDDTSDEPMFERINLLLQDQPQFAAFTVTVGKKPSAANAYVDDSNSVLELLATLVKTLQRDKTFLSVTDLSSQGVSDLSAVAHELKSEPNERPLSGLPGSISTGRLSSSSTERKGTNMEYSRSDSHSIPPVSSLCMKDYMSSLSEDHQEDDDMGGISF